MAVCEGQNIKDLKDEEIFGYPVESGMGCFMDLETQNLLNNLELNFLRKKEKIFWEFMKSFFINIFTTKMGL
jgi:hypothetical protein